MWQNFAIIVKIIDYFLIIIIFSCKFCIPIFLVSVYLLYLIIISNFFALRATLLPLWSK
jgi:hypothetical protein